MKRKYLLLLLCLFLCLFLAGCGSTEPEETVEETPVVEVVPETPAPEPAPAPAPAPAPEPAPAPVVDDSAAKAEEAARAEAAKRAAAEKAVAEARDAAIKAGAADLLPDELGLIDETVAEAMSGDDYEANAKKAALYYAALEKAAKGCALYDELVEEGYDVYAPEEFAAAEKAIDELIDLWYEDADITVIAAKIDEAYALLEATRAAGYQEALVRKAAQLERQVEYYRNQVLETNAARDYADYLAMIDEDADEIRARYAETGDLAAATLAADDVIAGYKALVEAALAEEAYWKIYDNDLEDRDPARYEKGWAAVEAVFALDEDGSEDWKAYLEQATIAHECFRKIVDDAFKNDAEAERSRYEDVKKKADAIKANVAAKTEYAAAAKLLLDGDAQASRSSWEKAFGCYSKAADAMTDVYETVSKKRNAAQEAMDRAKQQAAEVEKLAVEADELAPLSEEEAAE